MVVELEWLRGEGTFLKAICFKWLLTYMYDKLLQYIKLVIIWSVIVCSSYPLNKTCNLNQNWFDKNQFMICKREAIIERFFMGKWTLDRHQKNHQLFGDFFS